MTNNDSPENNPFDLGTPATPGYKATNANTSTPLNNGEEKLQELLREWQKDNPRFGEDIANLENELNLFNAKWGTNLTLYSIPKSALLEVLESNKKGVSSIVYLTNPPQYPKTNSEEYVEGWNDCLEDLIERLKLK